MRIFNLLDTLNFRMNNNKETLPPTFLSSASEILGDTNRGLRGSEIAGLVSGYASEYDIEIPYYEYPFKQSPNKRTALLQNLKPFLAHQQYRIIKELCEYLNEHQTNSFLDAYKNNEKDEYLNKLSNLKRQLIVKYGKQFGIEGSDTLNDSLVEDVQHWLDSYPESRKLYDDAIVMFKNKIYERNCLDNLRLSLESLLKGVFDNNKSLENQFKNIGNHVEENAGSKEFSNMFVKLIDYYTKYQNTFVKHNDAVIEQEVEFIFEITSSFMKHLIKLEKNNR